MGPCRLYLILMADGQRCSFFQLLTCNLSRTFGIKLEYEYNINIINHHNISLFPNSYLLIFIRSVISCCECGAGLWRSTGVCGAGVCPVLGMPHQSAPGVSHNTCQIVVYFIWVFHIFTKMVLKYLFTRFTNSSL